MTVLYTKASIVVIDVTLVIQKFIWKKMTTMKKNGWKVKEIIRWIAKVFLILFGLAIWITVHILTEWWVVPFAVCLSFTSIWAILVVSE
jgi:hypothetical protein